MREEKILVTKSVRDSEELKTNRNIDELIEKRTMLSQELNSAKIKVSTNRKRFKDQKRKYKIAKRQAKKVLKAKIKEAKDECESTVDIAFEPMKNAKKDYYDSKNDKRDISSKLFDLRSEIHSLQKYKEVLNKKYVSESDEFIKGDKEGKKSL